MAHMIDMSNGQANMAYVGETPWHNLGTALTPGATIPQWAKAAGLEHTVHRAPVKFIAGNEDDGEAECTFDDKHVLYRSDTLKPLGIVSTGYNIVQPTEVLAFFAELTKNNGFTLETAGCLDHGRRVWALAKVNDGAPVIGADVVRPYVLLATSYDGSMATIAKLETIRVVCHNTLTMAVNSDAKAAEEGEPGHVVRVAHNTVFDAAAARLDLGIALTAFDKFLIEARRLAKKKVTKGLVGEFLKELLPVPMKMVDGPNDTKVPQPQPLETSKAFKQIMALFEGGAKGAELPEAKGTAWGLLNAVTEHVDWQRARSANGRMSSAWFGTGEQMKAQARDLLLELVK